MSRTVTSCFLWVNRSPLPNHSGEEESLQAVPSAGGSPPGLILLAGPVFASRKDLCFRMVLPTIIIASGSDFEVTFKFFC